MIRFIARILYTALSFVQALIIFRIIIYFFNFNTSNSLIAAILYYSNIFIAPFKGVLASEMLNILSFNLELTSILALFAYLIIGFVVIEIIKAFSVE